MTKDSFENDLWTLLFFLKKDLFKATWGFLHNCQMSLKPYLTDAMII